MTFPNRSNYTPGEKKRERKYTPPDEKPAASASSSGPAMAACSGTATAAAPSAVASRTRASGKQKASQSYGGESKRIAWESSLQMEMIAALAAFSPLPDPESPNFEVVGITGSEATAAGNGSHAVAPFLVTKQQLQQKTDDARQRLMEDELFQQQNVRNRLLSFANATVPTAPTTRSRGGAFAELDPFRAAVERMPALDAARSSSNDEQIQDVLVNLQRVEATSMQELEHAMTMIDDASIRQSYQQALGTLQEWHKRKFQQQLLQHQQQWHHSLRSGFASPLLPSSPCDALLSGARHPVKKRTNLSKTAKTVLRSWFEDHLHHPYPTEEEKEMLGAHGGITMEQVNNWFINTRGRKWKPMLTRLMAEKEAGECKLYDQMVERIEEPYRRAPTDR